VQKAILGSGVKLSLIIVGIKMSSGSRKFHQAGCVKMSRMHICRLLGYEMPPKKLQLFIHVFLCRLMVC